MAQTTVTFSPIQTTIFSVFRQSSLVEKFYWTGGTLLSYYYLHHRKSFDVDFFSETPFVYEDLKGFLDSTKQALHVEKLEENRIYDRWEFAATVDDQTVRFEFVYYNHDKKRLFPLVQYKGIYIDSLPDLAANKVMAYIDRNQPKDLFDVYALLHQKKFTAQELLALVEKKFGATFSEFLFWSESAKQLKNLDALRPYFLEESPAKQDALIAQMKDFFLEGGREYLARHIGPPAK